MVRISEGGTLIRILWKSNQLGLESDAYYQFSFKAQNIQPQQQQQHIFAFVQHSVILFYAKSIVIIINTPFILSWLC